MSNWYEFRAYNTQALYGFGTAKEADKYQDILNEGREINHYAAYKVPADQAAEMKLESDTEAFNINDELAARAGIR